MKNFKLIAIALLISYSTSEVALAKESSIEEIRSIFISECLIPNIENQRHSFISLFNDVKNKTYEEDVPPGNAVELLLAIAGLKPPNESMVRYLGSNTKCFKEHLTKISSFYGIKEDIFSNNIILSSPIVSQEIAKLTNNTRMYFIVIFDPLTTRTNNISWSQMYGTTMFSYATSLENLKVNSSTQIELTKEIERQFIHEQYIKRDAIQLIGTGALRNLPVGTHLAQLEENFDLKDVELLNDPRVKFSLANYRALQFEISMGFSHDLKPNMKCSEIVKKYNMEPLDYFTLGYKNRVSANIASWFLNSRKQMALTIDPSRELNYEDLDNNLQLCNILKTPYYLKGDMLPAGTDGPGCSGCTSGWLRGEKIDPINLTQLRPLSIPFTVTNPIKNMRLKKQR